MRQVSWKIEVRSLTGGKVGGRDSPVDAGGRVEVIKVAGRLENDARSKCHTFQDALCCAEVCLN